MYIQLAGARRRSGADMYICIEARPLPRGLIARCAVSRGWVILVRDSAYVCTVAAVRPRSGADMYVCIEARPLPRGLVARALVQHAPSRG